jgi:tetratricopeptide (TPR) repeat protein
MAIISKKDKLVEEAQKYVLRGQFDKAAKTYEQILALEPAAFNQRQKLAELLIKCGRSDDARKEFETVGRHFSKNGFYLKAIAVYKQLQKLFPADITISLTLAELNEKHGLIANALSEYKLVYEFHEKSGNTPEALSILERVQNIDPLNIPIRIKLAEVYLQQDKKDQAYATFTQTATVLLERGDKVALAKISAHIQRLFPEKKDFLIEILAEQINKGNAAATIESLQALLRSNPHNKRVWELIALSYQQLDQPQRVKIAYQHYLKFFPVEPAAMLGLIASTVAGENLAGTLELLDQYEVSLLSAGYFLQLEQVYHALDTLDPINTRIMEGLIRVVIAAGKESEAESLTLKLAALRTVTGRTPAYDFDSEPPPELFNEPSAGVLETTELHVFGDIAPEETQVPVPVVEVSEAPPLLAPDIDGMPFDSVDGSFEQADEEIEIDLDLDSDLDSPFGSADVVNTDAAATATWLDSVDDLFGAISTAPRGVKFGNEMENTDVQSHFDLGQAFKEMGLYDEAINEFRQASFDASRRIECLIMQCACLRERGEVEKAITMLLALLKPGLSEEENCAVKYELASGYEATRNSDEATRLLGEINITNPAFRDISSRLNAVHLAGSLDFSDDDLDDFGLK